MICNDTAEYVSVLCDGETIPPAAAQHIATCLECQARLSDYLAAGVELRRAASLEFAGTVPSVRWNKRRNHIATWWQKGWGTMRIPRMAVAVLITGVVVLASALAVTKVRAHNTGTVVLLSTAGPSGPLGTDCPVSTEDKNKAMCSWYGHVGSQFLAYKVRLLSRDGNRVLLGIRTLTYPLASGPRNLSSFANDNEPGKRIWFEPGEPLKIDVPNVGTLTLKGQWLDHMPILGALDPAPNELRLGRPLLLKDNVVFGDLSNSIGGVYSQDDPDLAIVIYVQPQGRFVLSQLPMKGAVKAQVAMNRISFEAGGHSWQLVSGAPVCRSDHLWVLYQPHYQLHFRMNVHIGTGNTKLVQSEPGEWMPEQ